MTMSGSSIKARATGGLGARKSRAREPEAWAKSLKKPSRVLLASPTAGAELGPEKGFGKVYSDVLN